MNACSFLKAELKAALEIPHSPTEFSSLPTSIKATWNRLHHRWQVVAVCAKSLQLRLTLWDPLDCSLPGSSLHGIVQARILEWVAISSSRGSSWPRNRTCTSCIASCIAGRFFTTSATWEAPGSSYLITILFYLIIFCVCLPPLWNKKLAYSSRHSQKLYKAQTRGTRRCSVNVWWMKIVGISQRLKDMRWKEMPCHSTQSPSGMPHWSNNCRKGVVLISVY